MADLVVTPEDLRIFLQVETIDTDSAQQKLDLAVSLAGAIVSPVSQAALPVVLTAAARAYSNPTGLTTELVGPYQATRPTGGVYLTKSERSSLRRLTGSGGAFSFDPLGANYPSARFPESTTDSF